MTQINTLQRELETYAKARASLVRQEGRFVTIADDVILGIFDTYQDALTAGYKEYKLNPFLVKQISSLESVANFSRHLEFS